MLTRAYLLSSSVHNWLHSHVHIQTFLYTAQSRNKLDQTKRAVKNVVWTFKDSLLQPRSAFALINTDDNAQLTVIFITTQLSLFSFHRYIAAAYS